MNQNNIPASSEPQQFHTPQYTQPNMPYIVESQTAALPPLAEQHNQFMMQPNFPYQKETQPIPQQTQQNNQRNPSYAEEGVMASIMYELQRLLLTFLAF